MTSKHTVPAMRELAKNVRAKADQILREAEAEAGELRAAAEEIDADADAKEARQQQPIAGASPASTAPCRSCGLPLLRDELGWRHADREAGGECPGMTPPVPAGQPMADDTIVASAAVTRTDGEVAK